MTNLNQDGQSVREFTTKSKGDPGWGNQGAMKEDRNYLIASYISVGQAHRNFVFTCERVLVCVIQPTAKSR